MERSIQQLGELAQGFCDSAHSDTGPFLTANFPVAESLLKELDLGRPEIEAICAIAKQNRLAAKIGGAGMGVIVYAVYRGDSGDTRLSASFIRYSWTLPSSTFCHLSQAF
jgi:mevalonate kinase